jgi:predicted MFS family arabinose efflux permease
MDLSSHPAQGRRRRPRWRLRRPHIPRRYAIFVIVSLAFALGLFQRMALAAVATDIMSQFHIGASELGSLGAYYFYAYALMQIPNGMIVDRWGPRRLMTVCLLVASAGGFIFALAPNYTWLAIGRLLVGLGVSAVFVPTLALMVAWFPARDLALWNGLFVSFSCTGTLFAGRPLVEATQRIGWAGAFLAAAALTGVTAVGVWIVVRDRPANESGSQHAALESPTARELGRSLLDVIRSPILWLTGLGGLLLNGSQASFQAIWAGPFLNDVYLMPAAAIGNMLMLIPLGQMAGNFSHGWLADRVYRSRPAALVVGVGVYVALWGPLALHTERFSMAGLGLLYAGSFGFMWSAFNLFFPILRSRFRPEIASTAVGVFNLCSMMGGAIVQQVFGGLLDRFTPIAGGYPLAAYELTFRVGLGMAVVGMAALLVGVRIPGVESHGHRERGLKGENRYA